MLFLCKRTDRDAATSGAFMHVYVNMYVCVCACVCARAHVCIWENNMSIWKQSIQENILK